MKLIALALLAVLAGCVQTAAISTPFDPAAHEYGARQGTGSISGQAFFRRNDGVVVYAAGSPVLLMPATPYVKEIVSKAENSYVAVDFTNLDKRLAQYSKKTQANGEGRFTFSGLANGDYLVATNVTWMAGDMQQGGDLMQYVTVTGGNLEVILTK